MGKGVLINRKEHKDHRREGRRELHELTQIGRGGSAASAIIRNDPQRVERSARLKQKYRKERLTGDGVLC